VCYSAARTGAGFDAGPSPGFSEDLGRAAIGQSAAQQARKP
jgi:hypothetical protein